MSRTPIVAGNWKMFTTAASGRDLAAAVAKGVGDLPVRVVVCPPYPYLAVVAEAVQGSPVMLGAQNLYPKPEGAYTGEVSPTMLRDVGCQYVIVGHSERRHILGETNELIHQKLVAALAAGLSAILCVGETLPEREAGRTESVLDQQLTSALADVPAPATDRFVL